MKLVTSGSGYLLSDDRASGGDRAEADMLGCNHCQALMKHSDWRVGKTGAYCRVCDSPICTGCAQQFAATGCEPAEKKFNALLTDLHRRQQNAKILGT